MTDKNPDALLPCPFCGPVDCHNGLETECQHHGLICVICTYCGTRGPRCTTVEKAVNAWNARATPHAEAAGVGGDARPGKDDWRKTRGILKPYLDSPTPAEPEAEGDADCHVCRGKGSIPAPFHSEQYCPECSVTLPHSSKELIEDLRRRRGMGNDN